MAAIHEREMRSAVEVIPGKVFWVSLTTAPQPHPQRHFFSIDNELVYWNFFLDFGTSLHACVRAALVRWCPQTD